MGRGYFIGAGIAAALAVWLGSLALADDPASPRPTASSYPAIYVIRHDHWTEGDERDYSRFIAEIGDSGCNTVDSCLHGVHNPFRATDPAGVEFRSDCADLAYNLRFYFAWKRGLPFGYVSAVSAQGSGRDIRYTYRGNAAEERTTPRSGSESGYAIWDTIRDAVSSATFRIHPDLEEPMEPDLYSPAIDAKSIRPGTMIYDPNGHVATIYKVESDGRIHYMDAHPDSSITHGFYDLRFVRAYPGMGAGFKNWRPVQLVGARQLDDGSFAGGRVIPAANRDIPDFSDAQFYGNGERPDSDRDWHDGRFTLNDQTVDWYDFVRAKLAGGRLAFDPLREVADMVDSNCADLHDRVEAVDLALKAGMADRPEPTRLPENIYGTDGDWETYSSPSRDARLKTAFKELRDYAERFVHMYWAHDPKLIYKGNDLTSDMLATYDRKAAQCTITYTRSNGTPFTVGYEDIRKRLFALSFDPYQCAERRWGATSDEFGTCSEPTLKAAWYDAEQDLRNQIDRTYEAEMDFTLEELKTPGMGRGVASPPDIDIRGYLLGLHTTPQNKAQAPNAP